MSRRKDSPSGVTTIRELASRHAVVAVAVVVAAAGLVGVALLAPATQRPRPVPAALEARALVPLEAAGVRFLLDEQHEGGTEASTTFVDNGREIGARIFYLGDMSIGSGTVRAGLDEGDALLDKGVVYLRGGQRFWASLGVSNPAPADWVGLPPKFLGGKLFYPAAQWAAPLAPTPQASITGAKYTTPQAWAHINGTENPGTAPHHLLAGETLTPQGKTLWIDHYSANGVEADLIPTDVTKVEDKAAALAGNRKISAMLIQQSNDQWDFGPAPSAGAALAIGNRHE